MMEEQKLSITYMKGDLIELATSGLIDVVVHGCNCFCRMKRGIAVPMAKQFGCDKFKLEDKLYEGEYAKLGKIDYKYDNRYSLYVVNAYTQYHWRLKGPDEIPLSYRALADCMEKINDAFPGKKIAMPKIGCGLAGGDWDLVSQLIEKKLTDVDEIIVVIYDKKDDEENTLNG
jgi:O-acetyl-ADP-ribose deacetylase (regulator of RNase III)